MISWLKNITKEFPLIKKKKAINQAWNLKNQLLSASGTLKKDLIRTLHSKSIKVKHKIYHLILNKNLSRVQVKVTLKDQETKKKKKKLVTIKSKSQEMWILLQELLIKKVCFLSLKKMKVDFLFKTLLVSLKLGTSSRRQSCLNKEF